MKIRGELKPSELENGTALFRTKLKFVATYWWLAFFAAVGIKWTIVDFENFRRANLGALGVLWIILGGCSLIALYLRRFVRRFFSFLTLTRMNRERIEKFEIANDGIHAEAESGTSSFIPWNAFTEWRRGKLVYALKSKTGAVTILPLDGLNVDEVEKLTAMLHSSIGDPS